MASTSSNQESSMKLEEWQLMVQVENPVDFLSLARHDCNLRSYINSQDLNGYFKMLNGPSYENLVKYLWIKAEIYDKYDARLEKHEKVLIDPSL